MLQLIGLILTPFAWAFTTMAGILGLSGALPFYLGMFFIAVVTRFLIRPFIGESHKESSKSTRKSGRGWTNPHTD